MSESDLNILMYFTTRTGMYVGNVSEDTIVSFIDGYEIGTEGRCKISKEISLLLSSEFDIEMKANGWRGQLQVFSDKNEIDWTSGFKKIILKYFYRTQRFDIDSEFKSVLKSRIESKIDQLNLDWVASGFKEWINEWTALVDLNEEIFKSIWSDTEFKILKAIDLELEEKGNNKIQITEKLLELRNRYQKITKTQSSRLPHQ